MYKETFKNSIKLLLIIITSFIGLSAFWGGSNLMQDPTGKVINLHNHLNQISFADNYYYLGLLLILAIGVTHLITTFLLLTNNNKAAISTLVCSVILLIWVSVQLIVIGWFYYSTLYFILSMSEVLICSIFIYNDIKLKREMKKNERPNSHMKINNK